MQKLILSSLAATLLTIVAGLVLATLIPVEVTPHPECRGVPTQAKKDSYTLQDLEKATAAMKEAVACEGRLALAKPARERYLDAREGGRWLTWMPWLVVPFLAPSTIVSLLIITLIVLAVVTLTGAILPLEAVLSGVAVIAGASISRYVARLRHVANESHT